jgi:Secretion system C-terminal sorting domain
MSKIRNFYFVFTILISSLTYSQITITQSDYTSIFTIGNTNTSFVDTLTETINIGQPGGNNNWNFTHLVPHQVITIQFVDPSTSPYGSNFPGANVASYVSFEFQNDDTTNITGESWSYYSNVDVTEHGNAINSTTITPNTSSLFSSITTHIPPFLSEDFPIEINKDWFREDSAMTQSLIDGIPISTSTESSVHNFHIDAWGTMVMPSGKTVDALRSREHVTRISYLFPGFSQTTTSVHYSFLGKAGESLSIFADSENPPTSGLITGSIAWGNDDVTSVEKLETVPERFSLKQNYPNPFNPSTKIEYSITEPSFVRLNVYDILGNEVAVLVNENHTAGNFRYNFDGSDLASGAYIVRLSAGERIETMKITLMK